MAAEPPNAPRTLIGIAMSAPACSTIFCASPSATPGARSNEIVLDSSPPSCEIDVGIARSEIFAIAPSGTIVVTAVLSGAPVDAPRWPGLAEVVTTVVPVSDEADVGRYRSLSAGGPCMKRGAHSMMTAYWLSSS